jgi:hypothetical protein
VLLELAAVGGDRVPGHVADDRRAAELLAQRVGEAGVDRAVLRGARRARGAAGDQLADRVEVRLEQLLAVGPRGGDEGDRRSRDQLGDVTRTGLSANVAILVEESQAARTAHGFHNHLCRPRQLGVGRLRNAREAQATLEAGR